MASMKYICPFCNKQSIYHTRDKKSKQLPTRIQTHCGKCGVQIDVTSQKSCHISTGQVSRKILSRQKTVTGQANSLPTTNNLNKNRDDESTGQNQNFTNLKNSQIDSESDNGSRFFPVTSLKNDVAQSETKNYANEQIRLEKIKKDFQEPSCNYNEKTGQTWRNHFIRWRVKVFSIPKQLKYEKENDMGSFIAHYFRIDDCIVEIHTNCKELCAILNFDVSYYENKPDCEKKSGLIYAVKIIEKLIALGIKIDVDSIERLQSDHSAHTLAGTDFEDVFPASASNAMGTVKIDMSLGKDQPPEIEFIDAEFAKNGKGLCDALVNLPINLLKMFQNLKLVEKIALNNTSQLNALIQLLIKSQPTPDKNPITKTKGDYNGIFI